jgi:two-component system CheB/CheR fusion protein
MLPPLPMSTPIAPPPRRVLVADDNAYMRKALDAVLRAWAFEAVAVHDGPSALAAVRELRLHAVVLDIRLPKLDGLEVARRIRADPANAGLLLIAMTGSSDPRDRAASLDAGFDHHLVKPVDPDLLRALLDGGAASEPADPAPL